MRNGPEQRYAERLPLLEAVARRLEEEAGATLQVYGADIDRVVFRTKEPGSFLKKAMRTERGYDSPLTEIEDQIAGRVIVLFSHNLQPVLDSLLGLFNRVERSHPQPMGDAEFGYESHHLVCIIPAHLKSATWQAASDMPETFELQVRTLFQHAYAEPQHEFGYKHAEDLEREERRQLAWIAASAWGADQALERLFQLRNPTAPAAADQRDPPGG